MKHVLLLHYSLFLGGYSLEVQFSLFLSFLDLVLDCGLSSDGLLCDELSLFLEALEPDHIFDPPVQVVFLLVAEIAALT